MDDGTLYGPLHSKVGVANYLKTLEDAKAAGGVIEFGGKVIEREGNYVEPTIITGLPHDAEVVHRYTIHIPHRVKKINFKRRKSRFRNT